MYPLFENHVRVAVDRIGGPTKTAHALGVSNSAVHAWIKQGKLKDIDKAVKLAALAKMDFQTLRGVR